MVSLDSAAVSPLARAIGDFRRPHAGLTLPAPLQRDVGTVAVGDLLDRVWTRMRDEPHAVDEMMTELMSELWVFRSVAPPSRWDQIIQQCVAHPLREMIHEDPFTARSFKKPRGYAGDAVLIDYIYSETYGHDRPDAVSSLGERIFRFNCNTPACAAVRTRRDLVAAIIDQVCALHDRPHILSVACGHLREATLCRSVTAGRTGRFLALDQDELSLKIISDEMSGHGVTPVCGSIKAVFRGEIAREKFDFIYSTGLYDYLDDRLATKLTTRLFGMLNPGGRLLVANFLPDIWGAAYMETFMDWRLIYRTADRMVALTAEIDATEVAARTTFVEKNKNIVFLNVVRH
jgi:hypothetical protein